MSFFQNNPYPPIPFKERIKNIKDSSPSECRSCKRIMKIHNSTYHFCQNCSDKYRHFGKSCDHPSCETTSDGNIAFYSGNLFSQKRILCRPCWHHYRYRDFDSWEDYTESRRKQINRPPIFRFTPFPIVKNPVRHLEVAECTHCSKSRKIQNNKYQLCKQCVDKLKYVGENCSICPYVSDGKTPLEYNLTEEDFICGNCVQRTRKYKISFSKLRELINIKTCQICDVELEVGTGHSKRTQCIDHDHESGEVRGVLCMFCNMIEGQINQLPISAYEFGKRLSQYLKLNR